jgi:cell division inhibitor SulA
MEEEELRAACLHLFALLQISEVNAMKAVNEALQYGYRQGYADAVVRISLAAQEGNAKGFVLH